MVQTLGKSIKNWASNWSLKIQSENSSKCSAAKSCAKDNKIAGVLRGAGTPRHMHPNFIQCTATTVPSRLLLLVHSIQNVKLIIITT